MDTALLMARDTALPRVLGTVPDTALRVAPVRRVAPETALVQVPAQDKGQAPTKYSPQKLKPINRKYFFKQEF